MMRAGALAARSLSPLERAQLQRCSLPIAGILERVDLMVTRRDMILTGAAIAGASAALAKTNPAAGSQGASTVGWERSYVGGPDHGGSPPGQPGRDYAPVTTPNGSALPWKVVDGVKVFHLIAEEVLHEFAPGITARCWGYNGSVHGPTIEAVEGDRVRVYVTNRLPEPTTVHWHSILLPSGMDGVAGLSQKSIKPDETFRYEFTLRQHGTFMYHSHHDEMTQMGLGMIGMFIIHPRNTRP